jgi:hypothetical protein
MWLSADPAMGEYIPQAPINDEAKKHNQNLPGMGGVYNYVNLHLYHYAGNNPVKLVDPDGRIDIRVGFGNGIAIKLHIQLKDGKLTTGVKVGVGYGGEAKVAFNDTSPQVGTRLSASAEGAIGIKQGGYKTGLSAEVSTNTDGVMTNKASLSMSVPGSNESASLTISDGRFNSNIASKSSGDISGVLPQEYGGEAMVFAGVGYETTIDLYRLLQGNARPRQLGPGEILPSTTRNDIQESRNTVRSLAEPGTSRYLYEH